MPEFRFFHDIEIRYGDLDPQWHVNNARFLTFMEQTRLLYLLRLGLWDGKDFSNLGLIVADVHIAYRAPIELGHTVRVAMRIKRLGNKSLIYDYRLSDANDEDLVYATSETVMVAYDYHSHQAIPVPAEWREKIAAYESIPAYAAE
jgi:acyl-CoA thioester hydrolase